MDKAEIQGDEFASRRWPESGKANREESTGDPLAAMDQKNDVYEKPPFIKALAGVMNSYSRENRSNTPDFILANFVDKCLFAFEDANNRRERWYGKYLSIMDDNKSPEQEIIDRIKEFDAINATRHFTQAEGRAYSELMQEWATAVKEGRISAHAYMEDETIDQPGDDEPDGFFPEMGKVNTRSPEGYLFNAAMAILTTEHRPDMVFGAMFKKVRSLAVKIYEDDQRRDKTPKFNNAGNRNEKPV